MKSLFILIAGLIFLISIAYVGYRVLRKVFRKAQAALTNYMDNPHSQWVGPVVYRATTDRKVVALTFDDGPYEPYTSKLLETLGELDIKATFFVVGENVERFAGVVEKILSQGHQVGNHSFTHLPLVFRSRKDIVEEIEKTDVVLRQAGVESPIAFRAPYARKGFYLPYWLSKNSRKHILFDFFSDPPDYMGAPVKAVSSSLVSRARTGSVLVLHDGNTRAAPLVCDYTKAVVVGLKRRGFEFLTIDQLMALEREKSQWPKCS